MKTMALTKPRRKTPAFIKEIVKNKALFLLMTPGILLLLIFNYLPMAGVLIAFKDYKYYENSFIKNLLRSEWVGFDNFQFFLKSPDTLIITRNTVLYNLAFILVGAVFAIACAIALNELRNRYMAKLYQSVMLLPYFLSWIAVSYLFFAFLSIDKGILNNILTSLGLESVQWYSEMKYWPFIFMFANLLKYGGYSAIVYLAAISGISPEYYEAAVLDGASKRQQITKITIPLLSPVIIIMLLLGVGRIFYADFGMFLNLPRDNGQLFNITNVLDTYVYRGLMNGGDIAMSSAAGIYQSAVGFVLVLTSNWIVRKIDSEKSLF